MTQLSNSEDQSNLESIEAEERWEANDSAWQAVLKRDRRYDGKFVYVAVTTGIYCRPSCPARHPHRRNVLIFQTQAEAERQGYIACLRCHPGANAVAPAEKSIKLALDYIEAHLNQRNTLNTLSQVAGLSPNHLQQTFKGIVGLSPKAFYDARRLARFRHALKIHKSISAACYLVGYGSSRALYEKVSKGLGMTPATYQRGGDGINIRYATTDAVLGRVLVAETERGVCAVLLGEDDSCLFGELRKEFPSAILTLNPLALDKWTAAVHSCQQPDPLLSKLPLDLRRLIFQARVLHALL